MSISSFLSRLFNQSPTQPEDHYKLTITSTYIKVEHPKHQPQQIHWSNITKIKLINTDTGPWLPDIWLGLQGDEASCLIPHGAKGYDEVYDIVSKYEGFNFENVMQSMTCTENREFILWEK